MRTKIDVLLALAPAVSIYYLNNFIREQSAKEIAFYNGFFSFCMWHPSTSPHRKESCFSPETCSKSQFVQSNL